MSVYLGLDIGTSSVKGLLVDDGVALGSADHPLPVRRPRPGYSEQDPEDWWTAVLSVVDQLRAAHAGKFAALRGIGLSGQMHGATLLDAQGRALRPCILWNDGRAVAECAEFSDAFPGQQNVTGNLAMPGFTAPKLLWVRRHEPDVFGKIALVLLPKAFVRLRLTGEAIDEMSDASGTLWLDVGKRRWSDAALAATGLSVRQMPTLVEGTAEARPAATGDRRALGIGAPADRRGRGWRQCGRRDRRRRDRAGQRVPVARHVGRALGDHGALRAGSGVGGARVLPCASGYLAPDGRHPLGRLVPVLVVEGRRAPGD